MNIFVSYSIPDRGLHATTQAPRELGGSQDFLEIRGVPRFSSHNFTQYQWESELKSLFQLHQLTNCLEILSEKGFEGDDAIFLLNLIGGAR
jgi:hypothetical protein